MAEAREGNGERRERTAVSPEDPAVLAESKQQLADRWRSLKRAHPDAVSDVFFDMVLRDIDEAPDGFALRGLDDTVAARESDFGIDHSRTAESRTRDEYEYQLGDSPTVYLPDGTSRPMTPEDRREIARVEGERMARADLGLPADDIEPALGMPRYRLRLLEQRGGPEAAATADAAPEQSAASAKERRRATEQNLTQEFGEPVPVGKTKVWYDDHDNAYLIGAAGSEEKIMPGQAANLGSRNKPVWKKWGGSSTGWENTSAPEQQETGAPPAAAQERVARQPELDEVDMRRRAREQLERERLASEQPPAPIAPIAPPDEPMLPFGEAAPEAPRAPEAASRPHMDHDIEASRLAFREQLLRTLDPNGYQMHQNAEYTGREGELERYYTFAGLPRDMRFTQEEIEWVRGGFQGEPPLRREAPAPEPEPARAPEDAVRRSPVRRLVHETVVRASERDGDAWNVRIEAFKGLTPKTVEQLIQDPRDNVGFSRLVESLDPRGIDIKRKTLAGERLTTEETRYLNFARYEFTRRMQQVEYVYSKLNVQDLDLLAQRDPDLEALMGLRGPQRTLEVFKREIYALAMLNRPKFDELVGAYTKLSALREGETYRQWEQGIRRLCADRGVPLEAYEQSYRVATPAERAETERTIREEVRGTMGPFRRLIDNLDVVTNASSKSIARRKVSLAQGYNTMQRMPGGDIDQIDRSLDTLTGMLRLTVVDNPHVSFAVQQEAVQGRNVPLSTESGPTTFRGAQEGITPSTQEIERTLSEHVRTYRTNYADRPGGDVRSWDFMSPAERRDSLSGIESQYAQRVFTTGSGWFASALRAMWESLFRRKMDELINKPVLT